MDSPDYLLVLLTLLLLPGMLAVAFTFFSGAMERNEHAKYVVLLGRRRGESGADEGGAEDGDTLDSTERYDASEQGRGWGS